MIRLSDDQMIMVIMVMKTQAGRLPELGNSLFW